MRTLQIEIETQKAMDLIQDLENLQILKIVKNNSKEIPEKLSQKFNGVFSIEDANSFDNHTRKLRKEWDNT